MQTARLHVAGDGVIWAIAKCAMCGDINKYLASDAVTDSIPCKGCGLPMDLQRAIAEANQRRLSPAGSQRA